jgi:NAD(P)-dependent dehydrogenase (short-subunit alcohol dehydrogenase family)
MLKLAPVPVPDLSGKTILVTGAGRGIGAELVRILVSRGAEVYAGVHSAAPIEDLPPAARTISLDVTSPVETEAALDLIRREAGKLDALVNNAGVIEPIGHLADVSSAALTQAFEVNVAGVHRMSAVALPLLRVRGGCVVNAGTGAATTPLEGWTAYCVTKAALHMLTRMMALEFADKGVRAYFIGIPPTDTSMQSLIRGSGLNPVSQIPQTNLIACQVPASCMAWLCSDAANALKESILDVRQEPFASMMTAPSS